MPALPSDARRHFPGEHGVPHRPGSELPTSAQVASPHSQEAACTKQSCLHPVWALLPVSLTRMHPPAKGHLPVRWECKGCGAKRFKLSLWSIQQCLLSTAQIDLWGHLWHQAVEAGLVSACCAEQVCSALDPCSFEKISFESGTVKSVISSCTSFSLPFCRVAFTEHHAAENLQG